MFVCWPPSSPGNVSVPCPPYLPWISGGNALFYHFAVDILNVCNFYPTLMLLYVIHTLLSSDCITRQTARLVTGSSVTVQINV